MKKRMMQRAALLAPIFALSACAAIPDNLLSSPEVELRNVQVLDLGFNTQTFLLSFDISNPNAISLPVKAVEYGVKLDGMQFASGETSSDFVVPAKGDAQFAISVDLNLLQTAPQLLSIVRSGIRDDIPYELSGKLGVNIPFAPPLTYTTSGAIRLSSNTY